MCKFYVFPCSSFWTHLIHCVPLAFKLKLNECQCVLTTMPREHRYLLWDFPCDSLVWELWLKTIWCSNLKHRKIKEIHELVNDFAQGNFCIL